MSTAIPSAPTVHAVVHTGPATHAAVHAVRVATHSASHLAQAAVHGAPDVSVGHVLLQMVLALGVVIGGIWGFGKLLGRGRRPGVLGARRSSSEQLAVLSRQSLGKGLSIAAVRWGDREVLVGIAGTTITFLDGGDQSEQHAASVPVYGPPLEPPASARGEIAVAELARSTSPGDDRWPPGGLGMPGIARSIGRWPLATGGGWRIPGAAAADRSSRPSFLQALRDATTRR